MPIFGKTECSSKFCSYQCFLKKFRPSIILPNFEGKVMSGFQKLVSDARMRTCIERAYDETLHASYHSDSEILLLKDNQLKKQQIMPNTEQFRGRKLL